MKKCNIQGIFSNRLCPIDTMLYAHSWARIPEPSKFQVTVAKRQAQWGCGVILTVTFRSECHCFGCQERCLCGEHVGDPLWNLFHVVSSETPRQGAYLPFSPLLPRKKLTASHLSLLVFVVFERTFRSHVLPTQTIFNTQAFGIHKFTLWNLVSERAEDRLTKFVPPSCMTSPPWSWGWATISHGQAGWSWESPPGYEPLIQNSGGVGRSGGLLTRGGDSWGKYLEIHFELGPAVVPSLWSKLL